MKYLCTIILTSLVGTSLYSQLFDRYQLTSSDQNLFGHEEQLKIDSHNLPHVLYLTLSEDQQILYYGIVDTNDYSQFSLVLPVDSFLSDENHSEFCFGYSFQLENDGKTDIFSLKEKNTYGEDYDLLEQKYLIERVIVENGEISKSDILFETEYWAFGFSCTLDNKGDYHCCAMVNSSKEDPEANKIIYYFTDSEDFADSLYTIQDDVQSPYTSTCIVTDTNNMPHIINASYSPVLFNTYMHHWYYDSDQFHESTIGMIDDMEFGAKPSIKSLLNNEGNAFLIYLQDSIIVREVTDTGTLPPAKIFFPDMTETSYISSAIIKDTSFHLILRDYNGPTGYAAFSKKDSEPVYASLEYPLDEMGIDEAGYLNGLVTERTDNNKLYFLKSKIPLVPFPSSIKKPELNISDTAICEGSDLTVSCSGSDLNWSVNGETVPADTFLTMKDPEPGRYVIAVSKTFLNLESEKDSMILTVHPNPSVRLKNYYKVSPGDTLYIEVPSGLAGYSWNGTSGSETHQIIGNDYETGIYSLQLEVSDTNSCSASASTNFRVISNTEGQDSSLYLHTKMTLAKCDSILAYYNYTSESDSVAKYRYVYDYDRYGHTVLKKYDKWGIDKMIWVPTIHERYGYDFLGKEILSIRMDRWDFGLNDYINKSKWIKNYDQFGNLAIEEGYLWDRPSGAWYFTYDRQNRYNQFNDLTYNSTFNWYSTGIKPKSREWSYEREYDANDHLISVISKYRDTEDPVYVNTNKTDYGYDQDGNSTLTTLYIWDPEQDDWRIDAKNTRDCDGDDCTTISLVWDDELNIWLSGEKTVTEDTEEGFIKTIYHWNPDLQEWDFSGRSKTVDYTDNDSMITLVYAWDVNLNDWKYNLRSCKFYDEKGNLIIGGDFKWNSSLEHWDTLDIALSEYTYDADNRIISLEYNYAYQRSRIGLWWSGQDKYINEYDETGNLIKHTVYDWDYDREVWFLDQKDSSTYNDDRTIRSRSEHSWSPEGAQSSEGFWNLDQVSYYYYNMREIEQYSESLILLSKDTVREKLPAGTFVADISVIGAGHAHTYDYSLINIAGMMSDDRECFDIIGDSLLTACIFDAAVDQNLRIAIRAVDSSGQSLENIFEISVTGISESIQDITESNDRFRIYPNPVGDWLKITPKVPGSGSVQLKLFGIDGRTFIEGRFLQNEGAELDLSSVPAGLYLLELRLNDQANKYKIIRR